MARGAEWPDWWDWELDFRLTYLARRMSDRSFNETDIRAMLENANSFRPSREPGRWVIETMREKEPWQVVVEPQPRDQKLLVVTAYRVEPPENR